MLSLCSEKGKSGLFPGWSATIKPSGEAGNCSLSSVFARHLIPFEATIHFEIPESLSEIDVICRFYAFHAYSRPTTGFSGAV
jgi:hypothetical protein